MIKRWILFALIPLYFTYADEPSAFEKQSGVTKNDIKTLQNLISRLQQKVDSIGQNQEGLSSLYESQSTKLQQQIIQSTQNAKDIEELKAQFEDYQNLKRQLDANTKDIQLLKSHIKELQSGFSTLNKTILSELAQLSEHSDKTQHSATNETSTSNTHQQVTPFTKDKSKRAEIFTQAKDFFKKQSYESAKIRFEWLLEINYKKADSHFYLGEIAMADKAYNVAISHYKESVLLNDKTSYMPTLLLHTAQSFNAIKDTKNYNKFLDSLISNYPTSKEAQEAKKLKNQKKEKK